MLWGNYFLALCPLKFTNLSFIPPPFQLVKRIHNLLSGNKKAQIKVIQGFSCLFGVYFWQRSLLDIKYVKHCRFAPTLAYAIVGVPIATSGRPTITRGLPLSI